MFSGVQSDCIGDHPEIATEVLAMAGKADSVAVKEELVKYYMRFTEYGQSEGSEKECEMLVSIKGVSDELFLQHVATEARKRGIESPLEESAALFVHSANAMEAVAQKFDAQDSALEKLLSAGETAVSAAAHVRKHGRHSCQALIDFMRMDKANRYAAQKAIKAGAQLAQQMQAASVASLGYSSELLKGKYEYAVITANLRATRSMTQTIRKHTGQGLDEVHKVLAQAQSATARIIKDKAMKELLDTSKMTTGATEMAQRATSGTFGIKQLQQIDEALSGGFSNIASIASMCSR